MTTTAVEAVKSDLDAIEQKLKGYDDLVEQRDRLQMALQALEGSLATTRPRNIGQ